MARSSTSTDLVTLSLHSPGVYISTLTTISRGVYIYKTSIVHHNVFPNMLLCRYATLKVMSILLSIFLTHLLKLLHVTNKGVCHTISVHRMLRVLPLLLLRQVFTSSQSQICLSVRFGFVHCFICICEILRELFHKASHGSLPWHVFYLT